MKKKKKQMATQFINLITSKHHSYKETEAHLVSTKGRKNIIIKSIWVTLVLSEVEELSLYFLVCGIQQIMNILESLQNVTEFTGELFWSRAIVLETENGKLLL